MRGELEQRQRDIKTYEVKRDKFEDEIKEKKKQQGQGNREMNRVEEQIKDLELKLTKKKPQFIRAKETSTHLVKKLETAKTCYESTKKANELHLVEIETIKAEMEKLSVERREFEARIEKESLSQGINLELRASQVNNSPNSHLYGMEQINNPLNNICFWVLFMNIVVMVGLIT